MFPFQRKTDAFDLKAPPRGVDDGIPPLGPRQSLCFRKGARREVSLRLSRMNCHRQFIPTTTAGGCRGFESRHANDKKPHTLAGTGLLVQGSFKGGELTGTLPSFFAGLKTETLIYQCFYFVKNAKNTIYGSLPLRSAYNSDKLRFNASFILFVT